MLAHELCCSHFLHYIILLSAHLVAFLRASLTHIFQNRENTALLHRYGCDIKNQCRIGWNAALPCRAVSQGGRDNQAARSTSSYPDKPFVPALNNLGLSERADSKGLASPIIGAIKLLAVAL